MVWCQWLCSAVGDDDPGRGGDSALGANRSHVFKGSLGLHDVGKHNRSGL